MKSMRKIASLLLALAMIFALATTAFADDTKYSITISDSADGHTYEAYQIFGGDLSDHAKNDDVDGTHAVLSNIIWGSSVTKYNNIEIGSENAAVASDIAKQLENKTLSLNSFIAELELGDPIASVNSKTGNNYVISGLDAGYYLIKDNEDTLNGVHDAHTAFIIEVVENSTVKPKSAKPTVDKLVLDETGDADANNTNGWGETADHAINERFQFKLIAKLPADDNFAYYTEYKVVFNDTMSTGITFESIESVTVGGTTVNDYDCTAHAGDTGTTWTLSIDDIKDVVTDITNGIDIEVIYNAHLNENAVVGNTDDNENSVTLEYSNNPNGIGMGETTPDSVWVFTYAINSTKYHDEVKDGNELNGAGFTLYQGDVAVNLLYDETDKVYRPVAAGTDDSVTEMTTANGGLFNVAGLDVGTYILKETNVPAGYNKCDDITIVISANHQEVNDTSAQTTITMTIDGVVGTQNNVINNAGAELPETGGMGTTLFYIVGGVLVAAAVVLLVTKKRMASN